MTQPTILTRRSNSSVASILLGTPGVTYRKLLAVRLEQLIHQRLTDQRLEVPAATPQPVQEQIYPIASPLMI